MITYINMTPSQTLEERIVSVVNTGIDATATKLVCVTNGNLLRYRTLSPNILTTVYSGVFNSTTGETVILTLPVGIKFEFLLSIIINSSKQRTN